MIVQNLVFPLVMAAFVLITIAFSIKYCNLLKLAEKEYEKAKGSIKTIILSFSRNQERQSEAVDRLEFQMEVMRSDIEKISNHFFSIEGRVRNLDTLLKSSPIDLNQSSVDRFESMQQEIKTVIEEQRNIHAQLTKIEENTGVVDSEEKGLEKMTGVSRLSKITDTEYTIVQLLISGGAKTSSEVEKEIDKTREHTARLLKKLWQEGYIERDTHRIPYIYRITENLKKLNAELGRGNPI